MTAMSMLDSGHSRVELSQTDLEGPQACAAAQDPPTTTEGVKAHTPQPTSPQAVVFDGNTPSTEPTLVSPATSQPQLQSAVPAGAPVQSGQQEQQLPLQHREQDASGLHRLKIVGIPAGYSEEQLRSLFQLCGNVAEARIVHDKQSGRPVGYGYVSFFTKEAADLAISTFDDQLQLQGAANYLSVYYAKKQHDTNNDKESCPARNAKLYFCGTPAGLRRDSILALFSAFGRVRHLQVYTDSYGVLSSGTVTMYSTDEAIAAMNSLDGKVLQPGTAPLKVTWAQLSTLPRRNPAGGGPPPPMPRGFTVSYACIPTSVTPAEVAATFERFGTVLQVVPFAHRREGPANSRGCGLVVMDNEQAALAAVEALSGVMSWPGAERPLLVQPFYGAERLAPHQLSSLTEMGPGGMGPGGPQQGAAAGQYGRGSAGGGGGMRGPTNHNSAASAGPRGHGGRVNQHWPAGSSPDPRQHQVSPSSAQSGGGMDGSEPLPLGCAPDAFKLVLTNLPGSYTQSDVISLLQPYGTVVSLSHIPAGELGPDSTAVVWYSNAAQADAALAALSNTVLMAAEGTRQLELRAFKAPPARLGANRAMQGSSRPGPQGQHSWHSPGATQGMVAVQAGAAAGLGYQQHHVAPQLMQQGGYSPAGAQPQQQQQQLLPQGMLGGGDQVWLQGVGASTAPPGLNNMNPGGQLAALVAATAGMTTASNAYSMQQLLYMLPQQQQQQVAAVQGGIAGAHGGPGGWSGAGLLPNGAVSLSSNSNIESTLQSMQGASDGAFLGPPASTAAGLLAAPGAGTGYTGWLC